MKALSIHIPEPCHEDWQQMTPVDKGRFCQSCAKQVVDFSMMTDQEILNYISKASGGMCGRFAGDQLQRPLQPVQQEKKKVWWIAAMMPLLLLFEKAGAQKKDNCTSKEASIADQLQGTMGVVSVTPRAKPLILGKSIYGRVINTGGEPVPLADILVDGKSIGVRSGADGFFTIAPQKQGFVFFDVTVAGYQQQRVRMLADTTVYTVTLAPSKQYAVEDPSNQTPSGSFQSSVAFTAGGTVVDSATNEPIPFAAIIIKGTKTGVPADVNGSFKLYGKTPAKNAQSIIDPAPSDQPANLVVVVSAVGYDPLEIILPLDDSSQIIQLGAISLKALEVKLPETTETYVYIADTSRFSSDSLAICSRTLGYTVTYTEPSLMDTIPTFIRKVFNAEVFNVFPNPAPRGSSVTVEIKNKGTYSVQLFDNNGKLLQAKPFDAMLDNMHTSFNIPSSAAPGMYYMVLVDDKKKKKHTDRIMVL